MLQRIDFAALARQVLAQGHTTTSLGKQIGVTQPSASRIASGKTKAISADVAMRLIYAVGGRIELPLSQAVGAGITVADVESHATKVAAPAAHSPTPKGEPATAPVGGAA